MIGNNVQYVTSYTSPLGEMLLTANDLGLTGLYFKNQKHCDKSLHKYCQKDDLSIFNQTKKWLDIYFQGKEPNFMPRINQIGTPFRKIVWAILKQIPYGQIVTYGEIASMVAKLKGVEKVSAQAVGGAVGHNPISIIIPCHRVVGKNGSLTGYAGGIERKIKLLELEKILKKN